VRMREVYEQCCIDGSWEYVVRAFLLHVLGCTIFANKRRPGFLCATFHYLDVLVIQNSWLASLLLFR